ncbi:hypothetical protein DIURU_000147 [Diutina rugosa]|uniref:Uncharacterized protein n=1 Tax=Diutina rugosa TaxID=5481 RepID=A0A642UZQ0_DIURU|nr:uncharacterized protein DIURU_000147 [Diutina rugosa]KAA8908604.1 hypothetical protein DIURU_000147 [Diutina rugosa]
MDASEFDFAWLDDHGADDAMLDPQALFADSFSSGPGAPGAPSGAVPAPSPHSASVVSASDSHYGAPSDYDATHHAAAASPYHTPVSGHVPRMSSSSYSVSPAIPPAAPPAPSAPHQAQWGAPPDDILASSHQADGPPPPQQHHLGAPMPSAPLHQHPMGHQHPRHPQHSFQSQAPPAQLPPSANTDLAAPPPPAQQPPSAHQQQARPAPAPAPAPKRRPNFHIDLPVHPHSHAQLPGPSGSLSAFPTFHNLSPHYTFDGDDFGHVTPGMNPPSQVQSGYFEGVTPGVPGMRYDDSQGSLFSPQVESEVNNFNQDFGRYLYESHPDHHPTAAGPVPTAVPTASAPAPAAAALGRGAGSHQNLVALAMTHGSDAAAAVLGATTPGATTPGATSGATKFPPRPSMLSRTHSSPNFTIDRQVVGAKKKRTPKGAVCSICEKYISRDLTRHMRIHNDVGRFQCVYPKSMCNHKTQYFNRPYDYKKHLLHMHFKFDDPKGKAAHTLTDKLPSAGQCSACGAKYIAKDWLEFHVLSQDPESRCPYIEGSRMPHSGI